MLEQSACNSFCQYCEAGSGWERQTGSDLIGARLCCRECNSIVGMHTGCNARHDDRRDCDRGNAQRQFVEPIGIVEPRHRRRRNRGNCGCCYQLQLRDAGGDQARQSTLEKRFRLTRRVRVRALPSATGRKPDRRRQNQLNQASDTDGKCEPSGGVKLLYVLIGQNDNRQNNHHDQIKHYHAQSDRADTTFGVERRGNHCHQPDQNDVGRDHEQQESRERPALAVESGCDHGDDRRCEENDKQGDEAADAEHCQENAPGESIGAGRSIVIAAQFEPDWNERAVDRAF